LMICIFFLSVIYMHTFTILRALGILQINVLWSHNVHLFVWFIISFNSWTLCRLLMNCCTMDLRFNYQFRRLLFSNTLMKFYPFYTCYQHANMLNGIINVSTNSVWNTQWQQEVLRFRAEKIKKLHFYCWKVISVNCSHINFTNHS